MCECIIMLSVHHGDKSQNHTRARTRTYRLKGRRAEEDSRRGAFILRHSTQYTTTTGERRHRVGAIASTRRTDRTCLSDKTCVPPVWQTRRRRPTKKRRSRISDRRDEKEKTKSKTRSRRDNRRRCINHRCRRHRVIAGDGSRKSTIRPCRRPHMDAQRRYRPTRSPWRHGGRREHANS